VRDSSVPGLLRFPAPVGPYTTVMNVLSRIVDKGLVERVAEERTNRYRAAGDPEHLTAQAISQMVTSAADPAAATRTTAAQPCC